MHPRSSICPQCFPWSHVLLLLVDILWKPFKTLSCSNWVFVYVCLLVFVSNVLYVLLWECFAYWFSISLTACLFLDWYFIFFFGVCWSKYMENKILILKCSWTKVDARFFFFFIFFFPLHPESQICLIKIWNCFIYSNIWSYANHQHRNKPDIIFVKEAWGEKTGAAFCCWCWDFRVCNHINDERPSGQSASFTWETRSISIPLGLSLSSIYSSSQYYLINVPMHNSKTILILEKQPCYI